MFHPEIGEVLYIALWARVQVMFLDICRTQVEFIEKSAAIRTKSTRSPSSALLPFFGGRVPLLK